MYLLYLKIDSSQIDEKIIIERVTVSDEKVSVTSDADTLSKIDRIVAVLPTSEQITGELFWISSFASC